jgi:YfiH family protein
LTTRNSIQEIRPFNSINPTSHYNQAVTRPVPSPIKKSDPDLRAIDAVFNNAGLVRNRHGKAAGITRQLRLERAMPEELSTVAPAPLVAANGVEWLPVPGWEKLPWLWCGLSTRKGGGSRAYCAEGAPGELNLGFTAEDSREVVTANRRLLAEAITGDSATPLVTLRQIHSNLVVRVGAADALRERPWKGDGLMTAEPGVLLGIQTADCIPVLVADRKKRAVAAFHAGWRGTVKRIVESGVGRMRIEFGSKPEDLVGAIGPGVGACCYAVGEEVLSSFESQFSYARELFREVYDADAVRTKYPMLFLTQRAPGHSPIGPSLHLDLVEANRRQLLDAGLKASAIRVVGGCTSCQTQLFFSHRASQGHAGRMLSVIGVRLR